MREKIVLLNVLKYSNEKGEGTRIGFIFADPDKLTNSDKFIGYSEISQFYPADVFNKFDKSMISKPMIATFKTVSNPTNPLRTRSIVEKLEYNGNVIDLLQSE